MNRRSEIASLLDGWLKFFAAARAVPPAPSFSIAPAVSDVELGSEALAALAAAALAGDRTLWIVTADDSLLPEISNALDLRLRPLCLVLPGADHASHIALRATLSLLKSRLTRAGAESDGPVWDAQRARLQREDALWRASLAWTARGLEREAPPRGILDLFPVRIGPWPIAQRHAQPTDWAMLIQSGRLPAELCKAWPGARHTLLLSAPFTATATDLASSDATVRLLAELDVLGQQLAEMELELATAQGELTAFGARYHASIAGRIAELDRVQAALARARMQLQPQDPELSAAAQQAEARARESQREHQAHESRTTRQDPARLAPNDDLKKRFRQLAQKIHPDRAGDDVDRAWRTQLMSEANRAYRAGDAAALEEILTLWQEGRQHASSGAVPPGRSFAGATTLKKQLAAMHERIAAIGAELDRLYGSKLYELYTAARVAERQGRDLLAEMAARIDAQISRARDELAALG